MSTLRIPVAIAASATALLLASTTMAQETTAGTTPSNVAPVTQPVTQPVQPQPVPMQSTAPAAQPAQPVQPAQTVTVQQPAQPVGTTQTTAAPYTPSDRVNERTIERRPNRTLLSTGAGLFVLSYGASAIAGGVSDRDADKKLFIPVVGPWMDLGDRGCGDTRPCGDNEEVAKAMIVTSGIIQGAGVLMALGSFILPETTSISDRTTTAKAPKPSVQVTPVSFAAGAGLGAVGRF